MNGEDQITEKMLLNALRRRLLEELQAKREERATIQNIIGGGAGAGGGRGLYDQFAGSPGVPSPVDPGQYDYLVDIIRRQIPEGATEVDPVTGEPVSYPEGGWSKRVHRYRQPKKKVIQ